MRVVLSAHELESAYERCRSEAQAAFGVDGVYVERLMTGARHIEVQVLGDGSEWPLALGERECTLQRRFQKLVDEIERNKKLQALITDPDKREAFLDIMRSIQEELAGKS